MSRLSALGATSVRRWVGAPAAAGLAVAGLLLSAAGPARAADDILPTLTAFAVSPATVDVTTGTAQIHVTMSLTDPDATGVGTGDVLARRPTRGYHPFGHLVQVGGTATNTQYATDITLPAGKAVDYRMSISYIEAGQFFIVNDLNTQLEASGWPHHVTAVVTAPPVAPRDLSLRRELQGGRQTIVVTWATPAAGTPAVTGSAVTGTGCGTLSASSAGSARFVDAPSPTTTCTATVSLTNDAGGSPSATVSRRL